MTHDDWKAEDYATHAGYVPAITRQVLEELAPRRGECILDLGCGDGVLTGVIQRHGATGVGIDGSAGLVAAARDRGIDARIGDAQDMTFDGVFDAVFSNAALHWMPRQDDLIARVFDALKPGGRFVAEMGGAGNIALIRRALTDVLAARGIDFAERDPWTFPTANEQRTRLQKAGFDVVACSLRDRPTPLPTDMKGWFDTFCNAILSNHSPADRRDVTDEMAERLRPRMCDAGGTWTVDYVRLNFVALKSPICAAGGSGNTPLAGA